MVETKPNSPEYHGPDRRLPENLQMRQIVEALIIAHRRCREIDAAASDGERGKKGSLFGL